MARASLSSGQVTELINKMRHLDKDFRYMALNDLVAELTRNSGQLDDNSASRLIDAVLKTLEDANGEVQNMGVKCLGPLIKRSNEVYIQTIVDRLCKSGGNEALKDISATALRTVICELSPTSALASSITSKLTPRLLAQLENPEDKSDLLLESIDVVQELLARFGRQVAQLPEAQLTRLVHALTRLLDNPRSAVRKRSIGSLGLLSIHLPTPAHDRFMSELIELMPLAKSDDKLKTLIGLLGQISRSEAALPQSARRFSNFVQTLATPVLSALSIDDDELRETALMTLEAFVLSGGPQIRKFDAQILDACFTYIKHDPNYAYDEEEVDEDMEDADDASDFGSGFDETYSDDDDLSWKLRKGSAKLLHAEITTRPDLVKSQGAQIASVFIARFNEREETVCLELISAFAALLNLESASSTNRAGSPSRKRAREQDQDEEMETEARTLRSTVVQSMPKICKHLSKQMTGKSVPLKSAAFEALAALVRLGELAVESALFDMLASCKQALAGAAVGHNATAGSGLKLAALDFIEALIEHASVAGVTSNADALVSLLTETLEQETLFKSAAAALHASLALLALLGANGHTQAYNQLWSSILSKAKSDGLDHELRDRLIRALGTAIASAPPSADKALFAASSETLLQRVGSEATRLVAAQAIGDACQPGSASIDASWAVQAIHILSGYTRNMSNKALRAAALHALPALVTLAGVQLDASVVHELTAAMNQLLRSDDAQVLPQAMQVLGALAGATQGAARQVVKDDTLQAVLGLIDSPVVQAGGPVFDSMLAFLASVAKQGDAQAIVASLSDKVNTQNLPILARCIAVCLPLGPDALAQQAKVVQAPKTPEEERALALYVVGEYGCKAEVDGALANLVLTQFSSPSEKVKMAAAFALGSLAARDVDVYLPLLFSELGKSSSDHFLLAASLKEVISHNTEGAGVEKLLPHSDAIWQRLFQLAGEERAKATLAECVGRLTLIRPSHYLPQLQSQMRSDAIAVRSIVIRAVRHTFTAASDRSFDDLLRPFVVDFLSMMEDTDLEIRRLALSTLYSAAFHKPQLIHDHIGRLLPLLYKETVINKDLVHTVQMGPFKHTVDDGLVLRKSAFETLHTLLNSFFNVNEMQGIYAVVLAGLEDVHEIKLLSYLMLATLANKDAAGVQQHLEPVAEKLSKVMAGKPKENAVKSDREKDTELKRGALRCGVALQPLSGPDTPTFAAFWKDMEATRQSEISSISQELRGSF